MSLSNDTIELSLTPSVRSINVTIPPFKVTDPQLWFIRLEHYFVVNRVHTQRDKFDHASSLLPDEVADNVREILIKPDIEKPYDALKQAVIKAVSLSDRQAIEQLLSQVQIGDRTPSQLKNYVRSIIDDRKVDKNIFYQLWLRRLPANVQQILAVEDSDVDIDNIAKIADRIYERMKQTSPQRHSTVMAFDHNHTRLLRK
ncbi:hypothetical protein MS3_00000928 [Schistosoma haematobium]|uniref:DUF7041 domain-containing protein n=1 Tax=Schistosoma haematobium TaxID=6185 RepID=A0A922S725_SCHHA|nr:hypothetical protein MS3_00000928 [Schistosoma haematobium]KAH9596536.1 hypothetical protein MS3_00000928 [Schistosoma haematobium]